MTKWLNPEIASAQLRYIDEHASTVLFLDAAPMEGNIEPNNIVAEGTVSFRLPITSAPAEAGGAPQITFSVTSEDRYRDEWDTPAPQGYMTARRHATITHVAVVRTDYGDDHRQHRALYVTTCPPTLVAGGAPVVCAPFSLAIGGAPI